MRPCMATAAPTKLIIANSDLDKPLRRFDPAEHDVAPILEQHLLELLAPRVEIAETVAARVDALIARRVGRAEVTVEALAAEMSTSVRSLRRHLAAERTSFRQILQAHRRTAIEAILCSGRRAPVGPGEPGQLFGFSRAVARLQNLDRDVAAGPMRN